MGIGVGIAQRISKQEYIKRRNNNPPLFSVGSFRECFEKTFNRTFNQGDNMRTVELFAGTQSFSKVAKSLGHETFTVDNNSEFNSDLTCDLLDTFPAELILKIQDADVVWMSPPCTTFSLASGNTHWTADRLPKTEAAKVGRMLLDKCEIIARYCIKTGKTFFIEKANGRAVWFLPDEWLKRVWYCQYGDTRAKPTNIWTNLDIEFRTCHNFRKGQPKHCHHESAPRGSKTGTQGLKGNKERSVIPPLLFKEIFKVLK